VKKNLSSYTTATTVTQGTGPAEALEWEKGAEEGEEQEKKKKKKRSRG